VLPEKGSDLTKKGSEKGSDLTGQVTGDRGRVDDSAWGSLSGLPFVSFRNEKLRSRGD